MKKFILSLAIIIAASCTMIAAPLHQAPGASTEQGVPKDKKGKKLDGKRDMRKGNKAFNNPFEGIDLTDNQKEELDNLRKQMVEERKASGNKNLNNLSDEEKKALKEEQKNRMANEKKDYLLKLQNILTPEQYVKFLENNYLQSNNFGESRAIRNPGERKIKIEKN